MSKNKPTHKLIAWLLSLVMIAGMAPVSVAAETNELFGGGETQLWGLVDGKLPVSIESPSRSAAPPYNTGGLAGRGDSSDNPYLISTPADLKWLADQVNGGNDFSSKYFQMENDLDLSYYGESYDSGAGWTPIGTDPKPFKGIFDGNGHTISGLYINRSINYVGLFGHVDNGTIKNLTLEGGQVSGKTFVGSVAGYVGNDSNVQYCINTGSVCSSRDFIGGVAGYVLSSTVQNCINTGSVSSTQSGGGVVGSVAQNSKVENCINTGSISGKTNIGGIAGVLINTGKVQNCAALNSSVTGESKVGRIAGSTYASSTLKNNYARGDMAVNGSTVSSGAIDNQDGADSSDINIMADPEFLLKSSETQTVYLTASGAFKDMVWPTFIWESSVGTLDTAVDTFSTVLAVPADFTGTITVTAKPAIFPALAEHSITMLINGDLEGSVTVDGSFRYEETLTANPMVTSNCPGALSYQWMRGNLAISGANSITHTLTAEDIDEIVSVSVMAQHFTGEIQSTGQTVLRRVNSNIPVAPELASKTSHSITLKAVDGYEYAVLAAGSDTKQLASEGAFRSDPSFTGLSAGMSYDLYQRIAQSALVEHSAISGKLNITTDGGSSGGNSNTSDTVTPGKRPRQPLTTVATARAILGANGIAMLLSITMPQGATCLTIVFSQSALQSLINAGVSHLGTERCLGSPWPGSG